MSGFCVSDVIVMSCVVVLLIFSPIPGKAIDHRHHTEKERESKVAGIHVIKRCPAPYHHPQTRCGACHLSKEAAPSFGLFLLLGVLEMAFDNPFLSTGHPVEKQLPE